MTLPVPVWCRYTSNERPNTTRIRNRYLIKSAALFYSIDGQLGYLALGLEIAYTTLVAPYAPVPVLMSVETAIKLEKLLGRDYITREMLRPDLFHH